MKAAARSPLAPAAFPALPHVRGVRAATGALGLYKHAREDLQVFAFAEGTSVAGAFTTSATRSADVDWCRAALPGGMARALVCNAGNSNAFTGAAGVAKNVATAEEAARLLACAPDCVFIAATGVIGQPLEPRRVAQALPGLVERLGAPDWERLAQTFMTTDTFAKGAGGVVDLDGVEVRLAGLAKGSGMIAPDMATMLVFVFTDAAVSPAVLQACVNAHLGATFNAITVDGDTSTSDTLLVFATGASGAPMLNSLSDARFAAFSQALGAVMRDLALQVVRDGEGARKLIEVRVEGAASEADARRVARAIANSPLVKTAIAGEDANWGRVAMAVGKSGAEVVRERLSIRFGPEWTARDGGAAPYDEAAVDAHMRADNIEIEVRLGLGEGRACMWTCDLTDGYISINGAYRS